METGWEPGLAVMKAQVEYFGDIKTQNLETFPIFKILGLSVTFLLKLKIRLLIVAIQIRNLILPIEPIIYF